MGGAAAAVGAIGSAITTAIRRENKDQEVLTLRSCGPIVTRRPSVGLEPLLHDWLQDLVCPPSDRAQEFGPIDVRPIVVYVGQFVISGYYAYMTIFVSPLSL